jgi:hypothetical protein
MGLGFYYSRNTYVDQKILDQAKALGGRNQLLASYNLPTPPYKVRDLSYESDYLP